MGGVQRRVSDHTAGGWWTSLSGCEPTEAGSKTIVIPPMQRFGPSGIAPLMERLREDKL